MVRPVNKNVRVPYKNIHDIFYLENNKLSNYIEFIDDKSALISTTGKCDCYVDDYRLKGLLECFICGVQVDIVEQRDFDNYVMKPERWIVKVNRYK